MITHRMTLAEHNQLKGHYGGKPTGIQTALSNAGFDMDRDWNKVVDAETGDYIFVQADAPIIEPVISFEEPIRKPEKTKKRKKYGK